MLTAAIVLASRMAIVAAIVVAVSVVAARSGPVIGAMLASLPVSAGPAYVFLAYDHPPDFIVRGTVGSILATSASALFVAAHAIVSRRAGTALSLLAAMAAFLATIALLNQFSWTLGGACLVGLVLFGIGILATGDTRRRAVRLAAPARASDLVIRAGAVMAVVAIVTILGQLAGPLAAGYAALMPVVLMSFIVVMQPRVGGEPLAGLFSHTLFGLLGYIPAFSVIHFAAQTLGVWWALILGLLTTLAWNAGILLLRRTGLLRL